jgi:hypothetical protein
VNTDEATELRKTKRELHETNKKAGEFIVTVESFISMLDAEMAKPIDTGHRGRVAFAVSALELSKDLLRQFLGTLPGHERKTKR